MRSRKLEDALIRDPTEAAQQALNIVERGMVKASDGTEVAVNAQTLCIHGDTPGAPDIAAAVAGKLRQADIILSAFSRRPRHHARASADLGKLGLRSPVISTCSPPPLW